MPPDEVDIPDVVANVDIDAWITAVATAYRAFLNSEPTDSLISQWVLDYYDNVSIDELVSSYLNQLSAPSPTEEPSAWLASLYENLLGRSADEEGQAYWLSQLEQGLNPAQIVILFTLSAEAAATYSTLIETTLSSADAVGNNGLTVEQSVTALYQSLLGRAPDEEGIAYWQAQLDAQGDSDDLSLLINSFLDSDEFANLSSATDDTLFIEALYANLFDRTPLESDVDYWVGRLTEGDSPSDIVEAFVESAEYLSLLGITDTETMVA